METCQIGRNILILNVEDGIYNYECYNEKDELISTDEISINDFSNSQLINLIFEYFILNNIEISSYLYFLKTKRTLDGNQIGIIKNIIIKYNIIKKTICREKRTLKNNAFFQFQKDI